MTDGSKAEYEDAKREYHAAGKAAKGKPKDSYEHEHYIAAKRVYHALGTALHKN